MLVAYYAYRSDGSLVKGYTKYEGVLKDDEVKDYLTEKLVVEILDLEQTTLAFDIFKYTWFNRLSMYIWKCI